MAEIQILGKMLPVSIEGNAVKTQYDSFYNLTILNPRHGKVVLKPSAPGWHGRLGVTQFVHVEPRSTNVFTGRRSVDDGVFGTASKIFSDGTYYPPELGEMIQALGSYGYDISAFTQPTQR